MNKIEMFCSSLILSPVCREDKLPALDIDDALLSYVEGIDAEADAVGGRRRVGAEMRILCGKGTGER